MTAPPARIATDGSWLLLTAGLVAMVYGFGVNFPFMDEWPMTAALAGREPLRSWAWAWHNEHLLPLPRLLFWTLFQVGHDLRLSMLASVAIWSALTRLLIVTARRSRGGPACADAAFPLLLLHPGQAENVLMGYQIGFALSALLAGVQLVAMIGGPATGRRVAVAAATVTLLPLCGAHGLLFAGAGHVYLVAVLVRERPRRVVAALGLLGGLAAAGLYAWLPGKPVPPDPPPLGVGRFFAGLAGFGASGWGPAGQWLWPASAAVPVVVAAVGVTFLSRSRRGSSGPSWVGAAGALASFAVLASAISWGRSRYGIECVFYPRYVALAGMLPVLVFLTALRFGTTRTRAAVPLGLAAVALAVLPVNVWQGCRWAGAMAFAQRTALANLTAGVPVEDVGEQLHFLIYNDPTLVARYVEQYVSSGVGVVSAVRHRPPYAEWPLPAPVPEGPVRTLGPNAWAATGPGAGLRFEVTPPRHAYAVVVRGTYRYPASSPPATVTVAVRRVPDGPDEVFTQPVFRHATPQWGDPLILVWVDGPVASVRVVPDEGTWGFRVTSAALRVKP